MNMEIIIPILIILGILFVLSFLRYVRVPADKVAFISGFRHRNVTGKLAFYIGYFERVDYLDLSLVTVDVNTSMFVPTNDFINIKADAIVKLQIPQDKSFLEKANRNFLNRKPEWIAGSVKDVLEGNLREIIGQMNLKDMVQNRKEFNIKVQDNVQPDLQEMGLKIVSFAVQSFTDEKGVIDNLGIENISKISKEASIAKANAEKEIAIARANANKEAQDIEIKTNEEIAIKTNALLIKKADLKIESDTKQASADMTYELEKERKRKELEEVQGESNFTRETQAIRTNQAKLEAEIKVDQETKANAELYKRTKDAEAKKIELEKDAEAKLFMKQKDAEAIKFEASQQAEAVLLKAKAEADAIKLKADAEAEAVKKRGEAEAKATEARLAAEAEGKKKSLLAEAEGLNQKAEAMKKYGEGAILEMYFKALPEIAKNVAAPLSNIDRITMYGADGTSNLVSSITQSISKISDGVQDSTGIDFKSVVAGYLGKGLLDKAGNLKTEEIKKLIEQSQATEKKDKENQ